MSSAVLPSYPPAVIIEDLVNFLKNAADSFLAKSSNSISIMGLGYQKNNNRNNINEI